MDTTTEVLGISSSAVNLTTFTKPKRSQVKNACSSCQKACKKCDVGRPCMRCIKFHIGSTCVDSVRKQRTKARRSTKGSNTKKALKEAANDVYKDQKNYTPQGHYSKKLAYGESESRVVGFPGKECQVPQPEVQYTVWPPVGGDPVESNTATAKVCDNIYPSSNVYTVPGTKYNIPELPLYKLVWNSDSSIYRTTNEHQKLGSGLLYEKPQIIDDDKSPSIYDPNSSDTRVAVRNKQLQYPIINIPQAYGDKAFYPVEYMVPPSAQPAHVQEIPPISPVFYTYMMEAPGCQLMQPSHASTDNICMNIQPSDPMIEKRSVDQSLQSLCCLDVNSDPKMRHLAHCQQALSFHKGIPLSQGISDNEVSDIYDTVQLYEH